MHPSKTDNEVAQKPKVKKKNEIRMAYLQNLAKNMQLYFIKTDFI